ncbi:uncharacterized protein LOC124798010 [Schistocerca piceifrons]|uniref:uncharacterized protein LOC124798010 n=1 Tax=Schistocerca piceifrons TaxID=274613 RepID=UPI001F5EB0D6|nr:uncharacterized protein LOC124798010 [Schistocerca piceifrons]
MASHSLADDEILCELEKEFVDNESGDDNIDNSDDDPDVVQEELHQISSSENEESDPIMDVEPQNIRPDNSERRPRQRGSPARYHTGSTEEWTDIDCFPSIDIFSGDHGVTNLCGLDADSSVLDLFSYFVDRDLLAHYKDQTNLYARQKLRQLTSGGRLTPACRMFGWTGVTLVEVKNSWL